MKAKILEHAKGALASWRTTASGAALVGVGVGLGVVAYFSGQPIPWGEIGACVAGGLGLTAARDNKTSSAKAGAE